MPANLELQKLILWAASLRPEAQFFSSTHEFSTQPTNFLTISSLSYAGIGIQGVACQSSKTLSRGISIVETLERIVFKKDKLITTNGLAAHFSAEQAMKNGYKELVERDAFLLAFHWKIQCEQMPQTQSDTFCFKLPSRDPKYHVVLCLIGKGKPFYGLGTSEHLEEATTKSILEAQTVKWWATYSQMKPLTLKDFTTIEHRDVIQHQALALDHDYQAALGNWPWTGQSLKSFPPLSEQAEFTEHFLPSDLSGSDVCIFYAQHSELIPYYVGMPEQVHNLKAVKNLKMVLGDFKINLPHPFA